MTRKSYQHRHRLARLGSLGTLCAITAREMYLWFLHEVHDLRFPRLGCRGLGNVRTFDPLKTPLKFRRQYA